MDDRKRTLIALGVLILLPVLTLGVEFQFNLFERVVGLYMDARNEERERLAKFVDQETRNIQAQQQVETLLSLKQQQQKDGDKEEQPGPAGPAPVVRLEGGAKLVMSRDRFLEAHKKLDRSVHAIPQLSSAPLMEGYERWSRAILVRASWLRSGSLFLVDDDNYTLFKLPLSREQFDLLRAYAAASDSSAFDKQFQKMRVYAPQQFFAMLRGLPPAVRDPIISPPRFLELESAARRVGIMENPRSGQPEIVIETVIQDQVEVTRIPVTGTQLQEINAGLGEAGAQTRE